jgi:tRNA threonylcarbamoyladenosine biosynthesis protein TsaE
MIKKYTYCAKETISLGESFSKNLRKSDVVLLEGALGGGKTTFIKGVLKGLRIRTKVLSPSFTLIRHYKNNKLDVYHIDLYRVKGKEIFDFGIEDFLCTKNGITLIEWGEKIQSCLSSYIKIVFSILTETKREIIFSSRNCKDPNFHN